VSVILNLGIKYSWFCIDETYRDFCRVVSGFDVHDAGVPLTLGRRGVILAIICEDGDFVSCVVGGVANVRTWCVYTGEEMFNTQVV
jgi:hypothetical protein